MRLSPFLLPFVALLLTFIILPSTSFALTIATSIRPLYGIAAAVAGDQAKVSLILDTPSSPHDAGSKPSHILKITQANAVLLVNRSFETFLQRPLKTYGSNKVILEASSASGVQVLSRLILHANPEFNWRTPPKTLKELTGEDNPKDYHLWLNPDYGVAIAKQVHAYLVQKDSQNQTIYDRNLAEFITEVNSTAWSIRNQLRPNGQRFLAAHDGYQYFARSFALQQAGTISEGEAQQSNPAQHAKIVAIAADPRTACIIQDVESKGRDALALSKANHKPLLTADPLGQKLPLDRNLYPAILKNMGQTFANCLYH
ncbi:MAG: zinc ABC transporter substrate-binding protein [Rickettsiales bacterium]|nr:zinc ABC transporter substrate-binding protein [Rickettsiales bacterium]